MLGKELSSVSYPTGEEADICEMLRPEKSIILD
jgi:hypothetical protein